jgi:hypothetical protein
VFRKACSDALSPAFVNAPERTLLIERTSSKPGCVRLAFHQRKSAFRDQGAALKRIGTLIFAD